MSPALSDDRGFYDVKVIEVEINSIIMRHYFLLYVVERKRAVLALQGKTSW